MSRAMPGTSAAVLIQPLSLKVLQKELEQRETYDPIRHNVSLVPDRSSGDGLGQRGMQC